MLAIANDNRRIAFQHLFSDRGEFAAYASATAFAKRAGFAASIGPAR